MRASSRSGGERRSNSLARALRRRRAMGAPVIDLTLGNPTDAALQYPREAIVRALAGSRALRYEPAPFGLAVAREAVSAELHRQGVRVPPRQVILTASTSEAYGFLCKLLCDPGERMLVPRPGYPLFDSLLGYECVEPADYRLRWDGAWHIDTASVREAIDGRTRAIIHVSPGNPTGSFLTPDELEALASHGLPLISDEVFAAYELAPGARRVRSALDASSVPVFALGGLSKLAGLPQLKLGWIAVGGPPRDVAEALARLELIADTYLSVATPVQRALPALLESAGVTRAAIAERTGANLAWLGRAVAGTALTLLKPQGGWYAPLRLPGTRSEEAWVLDLLREEGVLVQPGWFYDFEGEAYAILSLLVPPGDFAEGVERLVRSVAAGC